MQPTSCLLILTCQSDAIVGTVTQVNVTAALASCNTDVKHLQVFSLIITIDRRLLDRKENLITVKNNRQLKVWQAVSIAVSVFLLALVVFALLVFRRKYGSWRPKSFTKDYIRAGSPSNQLQLSKFQDGNVYELS